MPGASQPSVNQSAKAVQQNPPVQGWGGVNPIQASEHFLSSLIPFNGLPSGSSTKAPETATQEAQQSAQEQYTQLTGNLSYSDVYGKDAATLGPKLQALLATMPYKQAQKFLSQLPSNSALVSAINAAANPQTSAPSSPYYDPLALQTMWSQVFGPAFQNASTIAAGAGPQYMNAMNSLIAGSNQSPQAKQQQTQQAQAMASLLQSSAQYNTQAVPAGLTLDSLMNALQQASGTAQLAQGAAEKAIAYGQAQPFLQGGSSGSLDPITAGALVNSAISGGQTGGGAYQGTGLIP